MKNFKKLGVAVLFGVSFLLFLSCSRDEEVSQEKNYVTLKFGNVDEKSSDSEIIYIEAEVVSTDPLELKSDDLIKIESVINSETGESGVCYILKESDNQTKRKIRTGGLFYGGGDCAIYGTYEYDTSSGYTTFTPGSPATQLLLNVCGLSNLA